MTQDKTSDEAEDEFSSFLGYMALAAVAAVAIVALFFFWHFHRQPISGDPAAWGQLGDFFGGTINPLFGMFSLLVLMFSLQVQRATLRDTRKQGVLAELQRLMATIAGDIDSALGRKIKEEGSLRRVAVGQAPLGGIFEGERELSVAEVLRYSWRSMLSGELPLISFYDLSDSLEAGEAFRALLRLDDCLLEFTSRGGDDVIGKLYGRAYGDAARLLATLHQLEHKLDLDAPYGPDALDRLHLPGFDAQFVLIGQKYAQAMADWKARAEGMDDEFETWRDEGARVKPDEMG